jgi:hypothetical protein
MSQQDRIVARLNPTGTVQVSIDYVHDVFAWEIDWMWEYRSYARKKEAEKEMDLKYPLTSPS